MRSNRPVAYGPVLTAEGSQAIRITPYKELRRSCLSALLFEDIAYESGSEQAKRIAELVKQCKPEDVANLAIECRNRMYLRHMPLFLIRELARRPGNGGMVADALTNVIQRPDELSEYLAIYWRDGKQPVSAGSKRGLARAFRKFNVESLAKYDQDNAVKLRDVLRIVHSRPETQEQSATWKLLIKRELPSPDTWEVALSGGADKKATFERLLRERKLGGLAFLRNLRNMIDAKVDLGLIRDRFNGPFTKVLPFRFIAAAQHAPKLESEIEQAMLRASSQLPKLKGTTVLVIDVSGSMGQVLSSKSELKRVDVAAALSILAREQCEHVEVYCTAGSDMKRVHATELVPSRRGMALRDSIMTQFKTLDGGGIFLVQCLDWIKPRLSSSVDRLIVLTDEQDCDLKLKPEQANTFGIHNYLINVSTNKNGVGYGGKWVHVDGWSERVLDFIIEHEVPTSN